MTQRTTIAPGKHVVEKQPLDRANRTRPRCLPEAVGSSGAPTGQLSASSRGPHATSGHSAPTTACRKLDPFEETGVLLGDHLLRDPSAIGIAGSNSRSYTAPGHRDEQTTPSTKHAIVCTRRRARRRRDRRPRGDIDCRFGRSSASSGAIRWSKTAPEPSLTVGLVLRQAASLPCRRPLRTVAPSQRLPSRPPTPASHPGRRPHPAS